MYYMNYKVLHVRITVYYIHDTQKMTEEVVYLELGARDERKIT